MATVGSFCGLKKYIKEILAGNDLICKVITELQEQVVYSILPNRRVYTSIWEYRVCCLVHI